MSKTLKQREICKSFFGFIFLIFISLNSFSQKDSSHYLGVAIEYNPQDFRLSLSYEHLNKHIFQQAGIGIAIRKTFFQQNFSPVLSYSLGWNWKVGKFKFLPYIRTGYSMEFMRSTAKQRMIHDFEAEFSGRIGYGIKNQFYLASGIGPAWEIKYNHYSERQTAYFYWTYFFQLGYVHRF